MQRPLNPTVKHRKDTHRELQGEGAKLVADAIGRSGTGSPVRLQCRVKLSSGEAICHEFAVPVAWVVESEPICFFEHLRSSRSALAVILNICTPAAAQSRGTGKYL